MGQNRIDKQAAAHLQEALRSSQRHVGEVRMASTQDADRDLAAIYGRIRRVLGELERAAMSPEDPFELALADEDQNLLVSCVVHRMGQLENAAVTLETVRQAGPRPHRPEVELLADLALRLATRPIQHLPKPPVPRPPAVRKLCAAVDSALGIVNEVQLNFGGGTVDFAGKPRSLAPSPDQPMTAAPEPAPAASAAPAVEATAPKPDRDAALRLAPADFDPRRLRDPRLRVAATLDLHAWEAAIERRDHRMAAVHLLSIVEAAVWDHALPRVAALGLVGEPAEWRLPVLVGSICPPLAPVDISRLTLLQRSVHFVHPARQLAAPMVITAAILADLVAFVRRLLEAVREADVASPLTAV